MVNVSLLLGCLCFRNVSQEIIFTQDNILVNNKSKSRLREYTSKLFEKNTES